MAVSKKSPFSPVDEPKSDNELAENSTAELMSIEYVRDVKGDTIIGCKVIAENVQEHNYLGWVESQIQSFYGRFSSTPFIVGDILNDARQRHSQTWSQVLPAPDDTTAVVKLKTLQNWSYVCARINQNERYPKLSFSHHAEVAYLSDTDLIDVEKSSLWNDYKTWCDNNDLNPKVGRSGMLWLLYWGNLTDATVSELRDQKTDLLGKKRETTSMKEKLENAQIFIGVLRDTIMSGTDYESIVRNARNLFVNHDKDEK